MRIPALRSAGLSMVLATLALPVLARAEWNPAGETVPITDCSQPVQACLDGAGGLFTFWQVVHPASGFWLVDVVGRHQQPDGTDAPGWSAAGRTVATYPVNANLGGTLAVVPDGAGGAFLFACENRFVHSFVPTEHRLFRMTADGARDPAWPDSGLVLGRSDQPGAPLLAPDGAGGVYAGMLDWVHFQLRSGTTVQLAGLLELRLARVGSEGSLAAGWPAEGVLVRGPAPDSLDWWPDLPPQLLADDVGGAILAWADSSGGDKATRVWRYGPAASPTPGWPAEGVTFSPNTLVRPAAFAADGAGGVYAGWTDSLPAPVGGAPKLQHLDDSGVPVAGWPSGGWRPAPLDEAAPYRWLDGLVADGTDGVYAQLQEVADTATFVRLLHRTAAGEAPVPWTDAGVTLALPAGSYAGLGAPVADGNGGVHVVAGLWPLSTLEDVRVGSAGEALPGWSLSSPVSRTLPSGTWSGRALGDGSGAVYVVGQTNGQPSCAALAFQLGQREAATNSVPATPAAAALTLSASPNPARGDVTIGFASPAAAPAEIEILDLGGRRVRRWRVGGEAARTLRWDGRGDLGDAVPPGLYFVVARSGGEVVSRRVAIVR